MGEGRVRRKQQETKERKARNKQNDEIAAKALSLA